MEARVVFASASLRKSFEDLAQSDPRLLKEINKALGDISRNYACGRNVKKDLIPKRMRAKYNVNNLWIYNLRKDWRLLYSVEGDQIEVLAIVLDWMNHKQYERLFKFA